MSIRPPPESLPVRLGQARRAANLKQADVAAALGVDPKAISQWERDPASGAKRKPTRPDIEKLPRLARLYGMTVDELLTGEPPKLTLPDVPVAGYVGAGAEIHFARDSAQEIDQAPPFPGQDGPAVAVRVRGDSMWPMVEDGWLLYFERPIDDLERNAVRENCINQLCVVQVHDGAALVKKLERGRRKGLYRLVSYNAPPREDVRLDWAARVRAIVP